MECCDAIDCVRADDGEMGHVDALLAVLLDDAHARAAVQVSRVECRDVVQMAAVDLIHDHQVPGEDALEKRYRPARHGVRVG